MSALLRKTSHLRKLYYTSRQVFRFSGATKIFGLPAGAPELPQCAYGSSMVFQRNLAKVAPRYENGEESSKVSDALPTDEFIGRMLSKLDSDARRVGYVARKDVEAVFNRVKKSGTISSIQSLYLIRCCGSLLSYDTPNARLALVHEIWSTLQEIGVPMDASHYNALLKCYLENDSKFSPPEFLAAMEEKGITPNRVTYQRVIERYCQDGDLSGASAVLEHMKGQDFPINENIFNSLVSGHAKARDMKGAANMLDVMKKSQLEPSADTYAALASGFAENGDMEGFFNTVREAEGKELYFSSKNYLQMIESLAVSGNNEYIEEIISKVNIRDNRPMIVCTALSLINRGFVDGAYKIAMHFGSENLSGFFYPFMRALAGKEEFTEKMISYCQDIFSRGMYEHIYEDAAKAILIYGKIDHVIELYKAMEEVGRPIRCHYFWPLFVTYGKDGNFEGIWSTLKLMNEMGIPADSDTYVDFILPHVPLSDVSAVIARVKESGQSEATVTDAFFTYYCFKGEAKAAAEFGREYKPQYNLGFIINLLASNPGSDAESVVVLLKQLRDNIMDPESKNDVFGMFLNRLLFHHHSNINLFHRFIQEYNSQEIKLPTLYVETLSSQLRILAPELVRPVQNLELNVIRDMFKSSDYTRPSELSIEELEKELVHLKETGGNLRPVLRHLFSHYCKKKDIMRVLEIKQELDAIGFTYSPAAYALLVNLFVTYNNLEEAMKYKKEIDAQYPHFKLDAAKAIDYVALMIRCDRVDEALEVIRNEAQDWLTPRYSDLLMTSVKNLLHTAADTGNVDITRKLFEIFTLDLKFVPVHYLTVEPLVKVHIVRNDIDAAIEEYRNCVVNYKVFPGRNFLFRKFIAAKDPERLQKVVDISAMYSGKDISLHELAAAFVECGCVQEARKVIQTLGTKADLKLLETICYRYYKQEKVLELEQFVGITRDLYHIDRDQLYTHLLNLYAQNNDYQAALEMWNAMQEDNVQPSPSTLQQLAALLEKNNQPVPFVVPVHFQVNDRFELMKLLADKKEAETIDALKRMKKGEIHALTPDVFTKIVDLAVEKKCLKEITDIVQVMSCILSKPSEILMPVARKYAEAGDIAALKSLHACMPDFAHRYMNFNSHFFEAHLVSGKPEALLEELEKNIGTSRNIFSLNGFLKLLQLHPEYFDRAVKLADAYYNQEKFDAPRVVLWLHYLCQERYEEAEEMYKQYESFIMKTDFPYVKLMQAVRNSHNERLGRKLVDLTNETLKSNLKARAYSCFLDVLVHNGKLEEAVSLIEEANSRGVPTDKLLHPTLVSLKNSLIERNIPVPFVIQSEDDKDLGSSSDSD